MGMILSSKMKDDGKVIYEVALDYEESLQLKGFMDNIHIFSENVLEIKTPISQRGKNESTKYFLIPKQLRNGLRFNDNASCQKLDTKTKTFFIYIVDKFGSYSKRRS